MMSLEYVERRCDCCGLNDFEELWKYSKQVQTKRDLYQWDVTNVICKRCGFVFVSPCPTEESLDVYYRNQYTYWDNALDYNIENRLTVIKNNIKGNGYKHDFLEVGAMNIGEFQSALSEYLNEYHCIEPNESCKNSIKLEEINKQFDIIAAYFVLEHMPDPGLFFSVYGKHLKNDGVVIIEVPDIYNYPRDISGLVQWEHTNHFSPLTLSLIASKRGFQLVDISYLYCSRSYGFTAVFSKKQGKQDSSLSLPQAEYVIAKACITEGLTLVEEDKKHLTQVRGKITSAASNGKPIVVWAANGRCDELLDDFDLPPTAIVIDSNPGKKNYLDPMPVFEPDQAKHEIQNACLYIINTKFHADSVLEQIRKITKQTVSKDKVIVT